MNGGSEDDEYLLVGLAALLDAALLERVVVAEQVLHEVEEHALLEHVLLQQHVHTHRRYALGHRTVQLRQVLRIGHRGICISLIYS